MTAPDITQIIPLKYKAWIGLIGSLLTIIVPSVVEAAAGLDQPWPLIIGAVVALLTALGIYKAPYKPAETVLVHESQVSTPSAPPAVTAEGKPAAVSYDAPAEYQSGGNTGEFTNPWK